jgi:transposase
MSVLKQDGSIEGDERRHRRIWSEDEKRRIVAETREPDSSVSIVARRHDLNANLLFTWRRRMGPALDPDRDAMRLVPAVIASDPVLAPTVPPTPAAPTGRIEIALAGGDRVIVDATVDAAALARVIKVLSRR